MRGAPDSAGLQCKGWLPRVCTWGASQASGGIQAATPGTSSQRQIKGETLEGAQGVLRGEGRGTVVEDFHR